MSTDEHVPEARAENMPESEPEAIPRGLAHSEPAEDPLVVPPPPFQSDRPST